MRRKRVNYNNLKAKLKNKNIVFLDLWDTILIEINTDNLNFKRAELLNAILDNKYKVNDLRLVIEENIIDFKRKEKLGKTITAKKRVESILESINCKYDDKKVEKILNSFDRLYFSDFKPIINGKLIDLVSTKKIILVSNTGLVTSRCIDKILGFYGINNIFYKKYYSDKSLYCKPNPMFLNKIIEDNKISRDTCIYIGDSYEMDYKLCLEVDVDCCIENWRDSL